MQVCIVNRYVFLHFNENIYLISLAGKFIIVILIFIVIIIIIKASGLWKAGSELPRATTGYFIFYLLINHVIWNIKYININYCTIFFSHLWMCMPLVTL